MDVGDLNNRSANTVHVGSGEGRATRMGDAQLITRKISNEQTGGAYSLFEVAVGAGGRERPHVQHREDECFYVLEGEFEFLIEGASVEAGAGSLIYVSKGNLHTFKNVGETIGRMLVSQTPGGVYENFVEEVGEPAAGEAVPQAVEQAPVAEWLIRKGAEYGIEVQLPRAGGEQHSREEHLGSVSGSGREAESQVDRRQG
jgi:mannose-6-phosphate isomerase-like protein (cupin superfamily)